MPSTSFKLRCPTCGCSKNFEHYWKHVTKCAATAAAPKPPALVVR